MSQISQAVEEKHTQFAIFSVFVKVGLLVKLEIEKSPFFHIIFFPFPYIILFGLRFFLIQSLLKWCVKVRFLPSAMLKLKVILFSCWVKRMMDEKCVWYHCCWMILFSCLDASPRSLGFGKLKEKYGYILADKSSKNYLFYLLLSLSFSLCFCLSVQLEVQINTQVWPQRLQYHLIR